jgi:single-stranded DNA-specific DHH superfamily exonuclease
MAAGFSAVEEHLRPCSRAFIEGVSHYLKEKPPKRSALDAVVMPAQVREEALDELTRAFEPVGPANPAPRYLLQGVRVTSLDGEKLTVYAADGISNEAFEGRIAFSSYKWAEGWPEVVKRVQGVVVTPFRPWENSAVQLKVRDVIIAPPPGGQ